MALPGLSLAAEQASFESGQAEVIVDLVAPGYEATVNLSIPAGYYATNATMKVTGMAAQGNVSAYPEGLLMKLGNNTLWAFQYVGFGQLGRQDRFSTEQKLINSSFGYNGGINTQYIRLPKNATVENATMDFKGMAPSKTQELINLSGEAAGDELSRGNGVCAAGDVNQDGYDDVLVGGYGNDMGGNSAGRAYIYLGGPKMDNIADVVITGAAGDILGASVSDAGDVNNDGYDDVIIGAGYNDSGGNNAGRAYVLLGSANTDNISVINFTGAVDYSNLGRIVSKAGDVNNDSYDDVLVANSSKVFIYLGGKEIDDVIDVSIDRVVSGESYDSISAAGDLNADGYDDIILGATWGGANDEGVAYIFFGGQKMDNASDLIMAGENAGDEFGLCSYAGDVNCDGYDDVIIGAWRNDAGGDGAGRAYLYFGGENMDNASDLIFTGYGANVGLGGGASDAGDMNNDGYDDVIIGLEAANEFQGVGYVYFGSKKMDNIADLMVSGDAQGDYFGDFVSSAGDVNHDGNDEVLIGAPGNDGNGSNAGRAYVYSYNASELGVLDISATISSSTIWNRSGYFNSTDRSSDFADVLNEYLLISPAYGSDSFGNLFVNVPVRLSAKSGGSLELSNLSVIYCYNATVPQFSSQINNYLTTNNIEKNSNGNVGLPIIVNSLSAGRLLLYELDIEISYDPPPKLVMQVGNADLSEDSWNTALVDLYPYFQDDLDPDTKLDFSVVSHTNGTFVTVGIKNKRYLAADAFTGEANDNWTGTVEVVVACTDNRGQRTESNQFTIFITNVNDPPVIASEPVTCAAIGVLYSYNLTAVDGDADLLNYALLQAPASMAIDPKVGTVSWVPSTAGVFRVSLMVDDGQVNATQDFNITVPRLPNRPPRVKDTAVPEAVVGKPFIHTIQAEDEDGDRLSFTLRSGPEKMTLDPGTGVLRWTPVKEGAYPVSVEISDGLANITHCFTVMVINTNKAPVFYRVPVTEVVLGTYYSYEAKAVDLDNDVLTYSIVSGPPGMTIIAATGKVGWNPAGAGSYTVKLKVTDGRGGEALQEYTLKVVNKVLAKVELTAPSEGEKVKGRMLVTGKAVRGTYDVVSVQVRLNGGVWADAVGNSTWQYELDTTALKDGVYRLEARAFDGKDYSDVVTRQFTVQNQKAQGKASTPGFEAGIMLLATMIALSLGLGRRRNRGGDAG